MSDVEKLRKDMLTVAKAFGDRAGNEAYPHDHMTAKSVLETFAGRLEKINTGLSLVPTVEWQPIETAPRDRTRLLLFVPPYGPSTGHFETDGDSWRLHSVLSKTAQPTHWMPLPTPPEEAKDGCT